MKILKYLNITIIILALLLSTGCEKKAEISDEATQDSLTVRQQELKKLVEEESPEDAVEKILSEMTLEEKVYQMMFVVPESITGVGQVTAAGDATKKAIETYPVGGIIYSGDNLIDEKQTIEMISNTKSYSEIPLFIGVDEEGGRVARVGNNPDMGTTKHPPMLEIGNTEDPKKAYEVGATIAKELSTLGFNVDFAPVADILMSEDNVEAGDRSFGYDSENVTLMVESLVCGLQENGMSATLKHFPGAGSAEGETRKAADSHIEVTKSVRTIDQFRETEFKPFKAGIDAGADFVMMSHMILSNATEEKLPSSLSKEVVTGMLKEELGFEGIIITDAMNMGAIVKMYTPDEIGVMAVKAGVDIVLMPVDFKATHQGIVDAVKSGEISEERIDESVRKILNKKIEMGLWK